MLLRQALRRRSRIPCRHSACRRGASSRPIAWATSLLPLHAFRTERNWTLHGHCLRMPSSKLARLQRSPAALLLWCCVDVVAGMTWLLVWLVVATRDQTPSPTELCCGTETALTEDLACAESRTQRQSRTGLPRALLLYYPHLGLTGDDHAAWDALTSLPRGWPTARNTSSGTVARVTGSLSNAGSPGFGMV